MPDFSDNLLSNQREHDPMIVFCVISRENLSLLFIVYFLPFSCRSCMD